MRALTRNASAWRPQPPGGQLAASDDNGSKAVTDRDLNTNANRRYSANLVADVTADAMPNGVICAHMPGIGVYPSDAEVASVPVGPRIESGCWA
jgi:hypothetical protein